jgi:ribonuclease HI
MLFKRIVRFYQKRTIHTATIYVDGSFIKYNNNIKKTAGIGLYFPNGEHYNVCEKVHAVSANYSEMMAVYRAIKICDLLAINGIIYTDSEYVIRQINQKHSGIFLKHVKAHQYLHSSFPDHEHSVGNAIADALAKYGARM